ncbi:MAG: L,D-transpeptidase [Candidatus Marinimicrobia bacterium]|nr:L,D-transpeptidase [Candidatus Neomarinimicrobiota bacterium]
MRKKNGTSFTLIIGILLIFLPLSACNKGGGTSEKAAGASYRPDMQRLEAAFEEILRIAEGSAADTAILIDGNDNKLFLTAPAREGLKILASWDISASKYGYGSARGSNQTPPGVHEIAGKFGEGQPPGMCFYDRRPTGEIAVIHTDTTDTDTDPVTSRILWLKGLEPGNRSSYWRFIYIHGTNEEGLIGTPQSSGCIRMRNDDVIELYDKTDTGMYVHIIAPENNSNTEEE